MTVAKKKTARQLDAEIDAELGTNFGKDPWLKKIQASRGQKLATLIAAFKKSPAIIIDDGYRRDLVVRSGEMQNRSEGKLRATMFGTDGPRGHITRNTDKELAEELLQHYAIKSVKPATDAQVMRWTSSKEFGDGSKRVAFVQAINTLSWNASKKGKGDRAREIERRAHALFATDMDAAIATLEAGIKEIG